MRKVVHHIVRMVLPSVSLLILFDVLNLPLSTTVDNAFAFTPHADDITQIRQGDDFLQEFSKRLWFLAGPAIFTLQGKSQAPHNQVIIILTFLLAEPSLTGSPPDSPLLPTFFFAASTFSLSVFCKEVKRPMKAIKRRTETTVDTLSLPPPDDTISC
ncbi:hypothetical protein NL676_005166 [Syzygium grande]|nr:hypothetical protein NL676_005166 [Syzygium grande]